MLEVNVNWSRRFSEEDIALRVQLVEKGGIKKVWAGEFDFFRDPLEVAEVVGEYTSLETGLILRPSRRVVKLAEKYDVCVVPGNTGADALKRTLKVIEEVKDVYVGCSGRVLAEKAFRIAGERLGIMPNYVKSEFIRWLCGNHSWRKILPIGPTLILPSEMKDELLMAAILVMTSNRSFAKAFGFEKEFLTLSSIDIKKMIANSKLERSRELNELEAFLLENFTVSGDLREVGEKINSLRDFDGFILADPFFRDLNSLKCLKHLTKCRFLR